MGKIKSENGFKAPVEFTGSQRPSYNQKISFDLALESDIYAVDGAKFVIEGTDEYGNPIKGGLLFSSVFMLTLIVRIFQKIK